MLLGEVTWDLAIEQASCPDGFREDQPSDLTQVPPSDEMFERLVIGLWVIFLNLVVPPSKGKYVLAEHAQLGVDQHVFGFLVPTLRPTAKLLVSEQSDR